MLIAVESCIAHADREFAIANTWAVPDHALKFFDGPYLGVPDDYKSLPLKTKEICNWARDYDFMAKVDTDTYLSIPRLLASGFEKYDYVGYRLEPGYASGACYVLSHKSVNILADADWSHYGASDCEDVMVGAVLAGHGIKVHHDPRFALYQDVLPDNDVISSHLSSRQAYKVEMMYEAHKKALGL